MRLLAAALTLLATPLTAVSLAATPAAAAPPTPPSASEARAHLAVIPVRAESSTSGYSRDLFPHWITISGTCNTRETVLRRDGSGVQVDSECRSIAGSWFSPYDGATWFDPADVDIDHMVPLAEAWTSGASAWTTTRRRDFANDLASSQLWAVTDDVNQAKSDRDPAQWLPPRLSFRCMYARSWVDVKYRWGLSVDSSEKTALSNVLSGC